MLYLIGALTLAAALAGPPAQGLRVQVPAKKEQKKAKKVWTNEDLEGLREGRTAPVPEINAEAGKEALPAEGAAATGEGGAGETAAAAAGPKTPYVKEQDAKWYQEQIAPLRAEVERIDSEIRRIREFKDAPSSGTNAMALGQNNLSLTPDNQIQQLEKRRGEVLAKIDEVESQARRNGLNPGTVR